MPRPPREKKKPQLGSIISGTHRPQDLIPAFYRTLRDLAPGRADDIRRAFPTLLAHRAGDTAEFDIQDEAEKERLKWLVSQMAEYPSDFAFASTHVAGTIFFHQHFPEPEDHNNIWTDSGEAEYVSSCQQALFDALSEETPEFCFFGAHPGDGADFGFWFDHEGLDQAVQEGTVHKIDAGTKWDAQDLPDDVQYVAEVNDHGNVTIYTPGGTELLSVV